MITIKTRKEFENVNESLIKRFYLSRSENINYDVITNYCNSVTLLESLSSFFVLIYTISLYTTYSNTENRYEYVFFKHSLQDTNRKKTL